MINKKKKTHLAFRKWQVVQLFLREGESHSNLLVGPSIYKKGVSLQLVGTLEMPLALLEMNHLIHQLQGVAFKQIFK